MLDVNDFDQLRIGLATADQIRHAAGVYLNTENRALLDVVPAGKG